MDKLIKYVADKKYTIIDITKSINTVSYSKYSRSIIRQPNVILFFRRHENNNDIFELHNASDHCDCFFMNKNNYMVTFIDDIFDKNMQLKINRFLEDNFVCDVCRTDQVTIKNCYTCNFGICVDCVNKIITESNLLCPRCKHDMNNDE